MENMVGKTVKSRNSETSFVVEKQDEEAVYSPIDGNGVGLWLKHGNYDIVN